VIIEKGGWGRYAVSHSTISRLAGFNDRQAQHDDESSVRRSIALIVRQAGQRTRKTR
jgi:hypothetical protein